MKKVKNEVKDMNLYAYVCVCAINIWYFLSLFRRLFNV